MKATTKSEIQSASVARGTDNVTKEVSYVVKGDTEANAWYEVRWNNERLMWCCECQAKCNGCKHSRAVNQVLAVRRATIALAMGGAMPKIVAKLQAEEDAKLTKGTLNNFANRREINIENGVPMR